MLHKIYIKHKNKNHSTLVELRRLNICHFRTTLTFLDQGHKAELALLQGTFVRPLDSVLKGGFFLRTANKRTKNGCRCRIKRTLLASIWH